jgi:ATP-dependent Lon protease
VTVYEISGLDVSADIIESVDPVFYGDPITAALKALGMN